MHTVSCAALLSLNVQAAEEAAASEGRHGRSFYLEIRDPDALRLPRRLLHGLFQDSMLGMWGFPQVL